jgi:KDO2-lipid IV(A) lauroyltransferase
VVPAFCVWDKALRKYKICFEPALKLVRTDNNEADAIANTAMFTREIERYVTRYPDQWLWVHRRWKTRPHGEAPIY